MFDGRASGRDLALRGMMNCRRARKHCKKGIRATQEVGKYEEGWLSVGQTRWSPSCQDPRMTNLSLQIGQIHHHSQLMIETKVIRRAGQKNSRHVYTTRGTAC